jgi:hypothetical protein
LIGTGLTSAASPRVHISSTCKVGQKLGVSLPLLTCFPSAWPSRLLYRRGRKSRRDLWITLYLSETFLILRIIQPDMTKMYIALRVNYPSFLSDPNETLFFSTDYRKILKYNILWKSVQWQPSCSMRRDGWTDRHYEDKKRFSQFCDGA